MKLGGPIVERFDTPEAWAQCVLDARFAAVPCPVDCRAPMEEAREYVSQAERIGVTIAEVGVWRNPIAPDDEQRREALAYAKAQLAFADEIGANCCVNIVGAAGPRWDGAYPENYSEATYALIVDSIREIIDAVRPVRTYYTIEPMPWMVPDGPDAYVKLLRDVDRPRLAVHMDFVNMINSAPRCLFAEDFIDECFRKLGPYIKSIHAKDVLLEAPFTTMIREVAPGKGRLNYARVLRAIHTLGPTTPVLLEHLDSTQAYRDAYDHVAGAAREHNIPIR